MTLSEVLNGRAGNPEWNAERGLLAIVIAFGIATTLILLDHPNLESSAIVIVAAGLAELIRQSVLTALNPRE